MVCSMSRFVLLHQGLASYREVYCYCNREQFGNLDLEHE